MENNNKRENFKRFYAKFLNLFYPSSIKCVFCGNELIDNSQNGSCENCNKSLPYVFNECAKCGNPLDAAGVVCLDCKRNNYNFDVARSVFVFEGRVKRAVHKYKYFSAKLLAEPFANFMLEKFKTCNFLPDLITFVPMHPKKQKVRGFNQAELLANIIAENLNIDCKNVILKTKETASQTKMSYLERLNNVKDCYAFNKDFKQDVKGKSILLVDDVFTTGATTSFISGLLKNSGARKVFVLTFAHTKLN